MGRIRDRGTCTLLVDDGMMVDCAVIGRDYFVRVRIMYMSGINDMSSALISVFL